MHKGTVQMGGIKQRSDNRPDVGPGRIRRVSAPRVLQAEGKLPGLRSNGIASALCICLPRVEMGRRGRTAVDQQTDAMRVGRAASAADAAQVSRQQRKALSMVYSCSDLMSTESLAGISSTTNFTF